MKLSNLEDVGQIRRRNGTSMKTMMKADALQYLLVWFVGVGLGRLGGLTCR